VAHTELPAAAPPRRPVLFYNPKSGGGKAERFAAEHRLPYVCVPAGTRNHFALDLGVNRDDVVGALDAFTKGGERMTTSRPPAVRAGSVSR
jgi:diacylglycerol kinase family enzyme